MLLIVVKMTWPIILTVNIIFYLIAWILIKLVVGKFPVIKALIFQFLLCLLIIYFYQLAKGELRFSKDFFFVAPLGFLVAFGAFWQWQAIKLSLSKTSLFLPLADVLTVALAGLFLSEFAQWSLTILAGVIFCFLAVFLFQDWKKKEENQKRWLFFTLLMIGIFGTAAFLMKVFSFDVPRGEFLTYWYTGTFLGSFVIFLFVKEKGFEKADKLFYLIPLLSLAVLGQLATYYWAFELAPASQVVPVRSVGITFLPVLAGWFIFKERKGLSRKEILAFLMGIAGALLIILA